MSISDRCPNCQSPAIYTDPDDNEPGSQLYQCGSLWYSGKLGKGQTCHMIEVEQLRLDFASAKLEIERLRRALLDMTAHRDRLIESSMEAWARVDGN